MGMGASNVGDRLAASVGLLTEAEPEFKGSLDVANGGVLFSLPSLLASGLLQCTEKYFHLPKGYYVLRLRLFDLASLELFGLTRGGVE